MPRATIDVPRADLEKAIALVEFNGPRKNRSHLHKEVAVAMGNPKITAAVVGLRIAEWKLAVKTPFGRITKERAAAEGLTPKTALSLNDGYAESSDIIPGRVTTNQVIVIRAPAGPCPFRLTDFEPETLKEWVFDLQTDAKREGKQLSIHAIAYHLRSKTGGNLDINGPRDADGTNEYDRVRDLIEETCFS